MVRGGEHLTLSLSGRSGPTGERMALILGSAA